MERVGVGAIKNPAERVPLKFGYLPPNPLFFAVKRRAHKRIKIKALNLKFSLSIFGIFRYKNSIKDIIRGSIFGWVLQRHFPRSAARKPE
jgi:hypothetical protein